ncbi:MAG: glycosyltransferase [Lachnospiraceae bacterium]|nr:glycosyltransferase [Lachnospiraceae bacterium]
MTISIITVCYNRAKTIERTIKSVINQDYEDTEYIVIDGGSIDGTVDIIRKYESDIAYWISEKDDGIYAAMNKGICHATGEIIAFLNSDDWYEKDILSEIAKRFEEEEIQLLCGNIYHHSENSVSKYCVSKEIEQELRYRMPYWQPAMFVSKKLFEEYGNFNTRYRIAADYDWLLRMYDRHIEITVMDKVFTNFSYGGISTQANFLKIQAEEGKMVALLALDRNQELTEGQKEKWRNEIEKEYIKGIENYKLKELLKDIAAGDQNEILTCIRHAFERNQYAVFGCGIIFRELSAILKHLHISIIALWDNNAEKWGKCIDGVEIGNPDDMKLGRDVVIVASTNYENEIGKLLEQKGFKKGTNYLLYSELRQSIVDLARKVIVD